MAKWNGAMNSVCFHTYLHVNIVPTLSERSWQQHSQLSTSNPALPLTTISVCVPV